DDYLRKTLMRCIAHNIISSQTNIYLALIVFHAFFSGVIKNLLMDNTSFNLYKQAPALADHILATLNITRGAPVVYDTAL
ncbi:acrEF/envCD operon transcriptional regulator, partial [Enterobacter hormaechei]|nr:acrEF/envCD operon transcriptional regulator [Enterobacter hormaechei]